jgi:hypothetical protein
MAAVLKRLVVTDPKPDRLGVVAIVQDQVTPDRIRDVVRELQLDDELSFAATILGGAAQRICEGYTTADHQNRRRRRAAKAPSLVPTSSLSPSYRLA